MAFPWQAGPITLVFLHDMVKMQHRGYRWPLNWRCQLKMSFQVLWANTAAVNVTSLWLWEWDSDWEAGEGRSSFVGVAGLAGLFLSTLRLQYLTSSPCLPTVTLMESGPKALGETPVSARCVWTRTEAMPRMHCALAWMYTDSTHPIKTPFQWQIAK